MSRSTAKSTNKKPEATERKPGECVHHWRIESPNGRESEGVCKRCGAHKSFANSTESVMWEQTNTLRSDPGRQSTRYSKPTEIRLSDED